MIVFSGVLFNPLDAVSQYIDVQRANFRRITHLVWPYSQNTIINSECKAVSAFSVELKVGTPIRDSRLPVVTGGAEPQVGGGIARAWIKDAKVYPGIPMPQWWRWVPEGTVVATGGRFVKMFRILLLISWLTSWKVLAWRQLADQLESSRMTTAGWPIGKFWHDDSWLTNWKVLAWRQGLVSFPEKKTPHKFKKQPNIYKNANILEIHHFHFFMKVSPLDAVSYTGTAHSTDGAC